ncbi:MAG TPA: magnesium transporter [Solimonas sp.]|nr:magnesium transporter [Solimonas sp.]
MDDHRVGELVRAASMRVPVDAAALLKDEPLERIEAVLQRLPKRLMRDILEYLPAHARPVDPQSITAEMMVPGTVADLMEPINGKLPETTTVQQAIDFLRQAANARQITYLYTVDAQDRLTGLVVIRDLLLAAPDRPLSEVMLPAPFSLRLTMAANDAVHAAVHRHYPVYPVVDADDRPVGVVRGWRLFEHQAIEITAQSGKMVGVDKEERIYTPMLSSFRMRHPWLQINLLTAFGTAAMVGMFNDTIARLVVLASFLPVLSCLAGNNGCQALATTIRGLTLGDLHGYPMRRLLIKEVLIGALNGFFTGLIGAVAIFLFAHFTNDPHGAILGLVMLISMVGSCVMSCLLGTLVPLTLKRFGADPATASSIFLLTTTDILGMGMMLGLATVLVH